MAYQTLLRRKKQLALLASACEQGAPARIRLRRKTGRAGAARLTALERDGVLLAWTGDRIAEAEIPGQPVEVRFEHTDEHYVFVAITQGRARCRCAESETDEPLRLSLPLRLERARRRQRLRLSLESGSPIMATFTHVVDGRRQFQARLTDIADGGLGITARTADVGRLHTGDLFWVDIDLPGQATRSELVARLVHLRPVRHTDELAMGWVFQPADDAANHERYLRRLEAFVGKKRPPANVGGAG